MRPSAISASLQSFETPAFERAVLAVGLSFYLWRLSVCCVVSIRVCASPPPKRARTDPAAFPSGLLLAPFNVSPAPRGPDATFVPDLSNLGVAPSARRADFHPATVEDCTAGGLPPCAPIGLARQLSPFRPPCDSQRRRADFHPATVEDCAAGGLPPCAPIGLARRISIVCLPLGAALGLASRIPTTTSGFPPRVRGGLPRSLSQSLPKVFVPPRARR